MNSPRTRVWRDLPPKENAPAATEAKSNDKTLSHDYTRPRPWRKLRLTPDQLDESLGRAVCWASSMAWPLPEASREVALPAARPMSWRLKGGAA